MGSTPSAGGGKASAVPRVKGRRGAPGDCPPAHCPVEGISQFRLPLRALPASADQPRPARPILRKATATQSLADSVLVPLVESL